MMPDPDAPDFDDRIRELLGRAIADTPSAPHIDEGSMMIRPTDGAHGPKRWLAVGAAGVSIAAVLVAIFLFARPDEATAPIVPATDPGATVVPPPPPSSSPSSRSPSSDATTVPAPVATPTTTNPSSSEPSTTTTTATSTTSTTLPTPVEQRPSDVRVRVGPDGVEILDGEAGRVVTNEPMAVARLGPGSTVYMQREVDAQDPQAESPLLFVDDDHPEPQPMTLPLPDGLPRLQDTAQIGGRWAILIELQAPLCANPDDCVGGVYVYWPDDGSVDEITTMNVWEAGWEQLSLSETGVIVGGWTEGALPIAVHRECPRRSRPGPGHRDARPRCELRRLQRLPPGLHDQPTR